VALVAPGRRHGDEFVRALETASRGINDPAAKLRFIRGSLDKYHRRDRLVQLIPIPGMRGLLYRWLSLEGVLAAPELFERRLRFSLLAIRAAALGMGGLLLAVAFGAALKLARPAVAAQPPPQPAPPATLPAVAEALAPLPAGLTPAAVWQVERGDGYELYSNGLRIETAWQVVGDARRYRVFDPASGLTDETRTRPAGLLFHTTESDIWPLEVEYNERLRDSSERLLRYLQRKRTYHYLIDRFGRVFRVVHEEAKANHAGHSIWEDHGRVYLNLNHAFLGVSFESRWGGGGSLPITEAQLLAGRSLTDYLRRRYDIPAEMCVAHGLTSVNPRQHRIGHHLDWSRGFPWAAFGLPDQYVREAPSVARFGFGYDDDFLKVLPEPWPGVRAAERRLADEAALAGRSLETLRRERQTLYDRWLFEQAEADRMGVAEMDQAS
jgi:uncharacterized SAM-binding protein YcdF (DUF218 family)